MEDKNRDLRWASAGGRLDEVKYLVKKGADIKKKKYWG